MTDLFASILFLKVSPFQCHDSDGFSGWNVLALIVLLMVQKLLAALLIFRNRISMPHKQDFHLTCLRETVAVEIAWQFNLSGLFTCPVCAPFLLI